MIRRSAKQTTYPTTAMTFLSAALALGLAACAAAEAPTDEVGHLEVKEDTSSVSGVFTLDDAQLDFASVEVSEDEFDVVVELNGMSLVALMDRGGMVAEIDGFAAGGGETQILEGDRLVIDAFVRSLASEVDTETFGAAAVLSRVASNWAQTPDTMPLQRQVAGSENRDFVSLCSSFGSYLYATHDGNNCSTFDNNCTSIAQVGNRVSPTFSFLGGRWVTTVPDHRSLVQQTGDCYGNCGPSCPGNNPQTLTIDCHDHDQCVRNGHFLASFFCNDEFASASDDEFFAPRCSGT